MSVVPIPEPGILVSVNRDFVTSCLDYCNVLYVGLLLKSIWKNQLVQNVAAQVINGVIYMHMQHYNYMSCIG